MTYILYVLPISYNTHNVLHIIYTLHTLCIHILTLLLRYRDPEHVSSQQGEHEHEQGVDRPEQARGGDETCHTCIVCIIYE